MPDFTLNTFHKLLKTLQEQDYTFQTFAGFLKDPVQRVIILRHDVDARKMNSLKTAQLENELGIAGTYYFRMVPQSFDEKVIKQIAGLGHEIGYHYEDVSRLAACGLRLAAKIKRLPDLHNLQNLHDLHDKGRPDPELAEKAIESFSRNLQELRELAPVETICMHGSPLSKYDNRMLWEYYDYRDFGVIGEPYFDINFEEVLYLTDTGRRWDGDAVSVRDKTTGVKRRATGEEQKVQDSRVFISLSEGGELRAQVEVQPTTSNQQPATLTKLHSTFDIINAAKEKMLPDKIMITVHPQRWDDKPLPWVRELVWQNIKNVGKRIISIKQK